MSKLNNRHISCSLIPENHEYSANEKFTVLCFYCNNQYKATSISYHFRNYKKALEHQQKEHKKQRESINKYLQINHAS